MDPCLAGSSLPPGAWHRAQTWGERGGGTAFETGLVSGSVSQGLCLCFIFVSSLSIFLLVSLFISLFPPLFYSACFCSFLYPSQFRFPFISHFPVSLPSGSALGLRICQAFFVWEPR